ncbi:DUF368 domain-containing protein [Balneolales bacterium ANBcel1]|nr:DUF368 domain-containing protein [Balneolales bacterium ANBcel1]
MAETSENKEREQEQVSSAETGIPEKDLTRPGEMPFLYLKGFVMGSADVVPGVSGGTMALILGIYSRLIFGIRSVDLPAIRRLITFQWGEFFEGVHWKFLISVFLGGVSAVYFFTSIVPLPVLMHTHPEIVYGLFFGLISGSIMLLLKAIGDIRWREALIVFIGFLIGLRIVTLVPTSTPETSLFAFLSGSLAITAMVLPGISGSFILLILRQYDHILGNIALLGTDRTIEAFMILVPFGLGMIVGLVLFVRLLSWLLKRFHIMTLCLLVGFMAGSLYVVWPYQEREYTEIVLSRTAPLDDPEVQALRVDEPDRSRPSYTELGDIINPDDPPGRQEVEIREVSRHLVSSRPYWPQWRSPEHDQRLKDGRRSMYGGVATMLSGFLLVGYLGRVLNRKSGLVSHF